MRLRFRHPEGIATLSDVDESADLATLKRQIAEEINLPAGKVVKVSGGYPPKPYNNDTLSLSKIGLKNGDALIVTIADETSHNMDGQRQANANTDTQTKEPVNAPQSIAPPSIVSKNNDEVVEVDGSYLVIREMEDDNSCLFRAVGYALSKDVGRAQELRETVAAAIQSDPVNYPEAILGQPVERYVNWIMKPTSWGGAIVAADWLTTGMNSTNVRHYCKTEIDSFDVATGRVDKFGEGQYEERILLMYTGIHYDALALIPATLAPKEFDQTRFPCIADNLLEAGTQLAYRLKQQRKFTDTANFTLKCNICGLGLIGERDATTHATLMGDESAQSKRQRVSRACDLCRRKKIKCDGTIPVCGNCQAFNLECGYKDTTKKRGPPKGYIEAIENRLHRMETLLGSLAQGDDPRSQALIAELNAPLETIHGELIRTRPMRRQFNEDDPESSPDTPSLTYNDLPQTMEEPDSPSLTVDQVNDSLGNLTIDDGGQMRYLGKSSGFYMLQNSRLFHHGAFHFGARLVKGNQTKNGNRLEILNPLDMPPMDLQEHLIDLYFRHFYPTLPILHKKSFMTRLKSEDDKPDALLLNAIFAIASRISPDERVREDPTVPDTAGEIFYERARFLLDQKCDSVSTCTIQALLLLSSHQHGAMKSSRAWLYNGMAFRMAHALGLNHNCDSWNIPASEREERKRVFWCCFIVDRYTSAAFGRSTAIDERDCDATFPTEEDDLNDGPPVLEYMRHAVRLSDILGHILRDIYSVKGRQLALTVSPDTIISNLDKALNSWYSNLPKSLKYKPPSCRDGQKAPAPALSICQLHMTYYTALILLHRPFIPGPSQSRAPTSFPSLQICTSSAYSILDICENLLSEGRLKYTLNYAIFHVFTAGTLFVNNATSTDSYLTFEAKISINKIMRGLDDMESSWTAAARYSNILGELAGLRDINLESDTPFKDRYTSRKRTPPPSIAVPNSPEPADDDYEVTEASTNNKSTDNLPDLSPNASTQSYSTAATPYNTAWPSMAAFPNDQFASITGTPSQNTALQPTMDPFAAPDTIANTISNKRPYDALGTAFWGMPPSLDIEEWNSYLGNQSQFRLPNTGAAQLNHIQEPKQQPQNNSMHIPQAGEIMYGRVSGSPEPMGPPEQQQQSTPNQTKSASLPIPNNNNGLYYY